MKQITSFWNWFQDNEEALKNAFASGNNASKVAMVKKNNEAVIARRNDEAIFHLKRNLNYISNKIDYLIISPSKHHDKFTIIFTATGCRKLFPKIIALEDQAPVLKCFMPQAFIKPIQDTSPYKNGTDKPFSFKNYKIKISQLCIALTDYNCTTKQLKIQLFIPYYDTIKHCEDLEKNIKFVVMQVIGEIAFKKHISHIELTQLPKPSTGLLGLIELPDYIDYLYKINARQKIRVS